jgi:hypothetical protein
MDFIIPTRLMNTTLKKGMIGMLETGTVNMDTILIKNWILQLYIKEL